MPEAAGMPEYGPVMGITVPQANTTVEPEMQALLGANHTLLTSRMTSSSPDSRQRLVDYLDGIDRSLAQFDVAPLQVAGFACTGSSYLVGPDEEATRLQMASARCGYPVLSAAQSIRHALEVLNARRIALIAPYPTWLSDAGKTYWRNCGLTLTASAGLPSELLDTRNIYKLKTAAVQEVFDRLDIHDCDAVLMSGTGMPTLRLMSLRALPVPVLSSNLCLSWAMQCRVQPETPAATLLRDMLSPQANWRHLLGQGA
ncbi:maleate cis-trans isomerase family protein [Polaromonas aquatica]|uniref:Arylmalonate decarboxylase n=1 Tax=Polaromonas aquatica TaxID=332657 RepID=A0ABW1U0S7_9BURK